MTHGFRWRPSFAASTEKPRNPCRRDHEDALHASFSPQSKTLGYLPWGASWFSILSAIQWYPMVEGYGLSLTVIFAVRKIVRSIWYIGHRIMRGSTHGLILELKLNNQTHITTRDKLNSLLSLLRTIWFLWSSRGGRGGASFLLLFLQQNYAAYIVLSSSFWIHCNIHY